MMTDKQGIGSLLINANFHENEQKRFVDIRENSRTIILIPYNCLMDDQKQAMFLGEIPQLDRSTPAQSLTATFAAG